MKKKTSATDSAKWSALQRRCAANAMDQDSIILKAEANSCRFYCAATCSRFGYTFHGCCCSRSSSIETIWPNTLDFHRSLSHKSWKLRTCRTVSHFRLLKLTNFSQKKNRQRSDQWEPMDWTCYDLGPRSWNCQVLWWPSITSFQGLPDIIMKRKLQLADTGRTLLIIVRPMGVSGIDQAFGWTYMTYFRLSDYVVLCRTL